MAHYGSATAKRHYLFSNSQVVCKIDRGVLSGWKKVSKDKQTAERYRDSSGKARYKGTSQLKSTQTLALFSPICIERYLPFYMYNTDWVTSLI